MTSVSTLAERVMSGDARAMARAISLLEDEDPRAGELIGAIFAHTGRASVIGVTGPPGAGKSTLVDRLATEIRASKATVGILAIDPTSPFSGGAVLGDRVRMQAHAKDEGVFIRSMATRGRLGGLAAATENAALVLDAAGKNVVIIETVGVGQDEVDIARAADVTIVTLVPGSGDEVQALKAGIMEIADIFVVNKADRDGADALASAIEANVGLHAYTPDEWRPPIVKTVATTGEGVGDVLAAASRFRERSQGLRSARRKSRTEHHLRELLWTRFMERLDRDVLAKGELQTIVERITARELDPYSAADDLLRRAVRTAISQRETTEP